MNFMINEKIRKRVVKFLKIFLLIYQALVTYIPISKFKTDVNDSFLSEVYAFITDKQIQSTDKLFFFK